MKIICQICPHHCALDEGQTGLCRARANQNDEIICTNYGLLTALALDPVEKKPLRRFFPGSLILSVGSYGCNLSCQFCQNSAISLPGKNIPPTAKILPAELVQQALSLVPQGNIGLAYTYNEPVISLEYVRDCSLLAAKHGLKNILVTNGYICEQPFKDLLAHIDAANIDLKSFSEDFYHKIGGDLPTVQNSIRLAAAFCHLEITTLIIPGQNDSVEEITALAGWIAAIDKDIPLHISRFFPAHCLTDNIKTTPRETVYKLADIARHHLHYVYTGNC